MERSKANKATVFVSYAHEDKHDALRLFKDLRDLNVIPWIDSECLLPGQNWMNAIEGSIKNSDFFIAIISHKSVNKRGYVQKELKIALDVLDETPSNKIYIIPVRIDSCEVQEPRLKTLHYVDLFPEWSNGIDKVRKAINYRTNRDEATDNISFIRRITEDVISSQLEYAIGDGDIELVEDLLLHGANPNYPTDAYGSLIGYALNETDNDQVEYSLAKVLLEYGANVLALGYHGSGLLHNVVFLNKVDITNLLIKSGADINSVGYKGETPLMNAANFHAIDTLKILLDNRANVNLLDEEGNTVLIHAVNHNASYDNKVEEQGMILNILDALTGFGANVGNRNNEGKSAVDYAREYKLNSVVNKLQQLMEHHV